MISELFILLLLVHFIADFALQSEFMSKYKQESWFVMNVHCFIWAGCIISALMWYKGFKYISEVSGLISVWFLFVGHYFSDTLKCVLIKELNNCKDKEFKNKKTELLFHLDQIWHIVQVFIVAYTYG